MDVEMQEKQKWASPCRSANIGTYMNDGIRKIDLVLAYPDESGDPEKKSDNKDAERRKFYEENLLKEGLQLEYDRRSTCGEDVMFIKVHTPWPILCKHAEILKIKTPMQIKDDEDDDAPASDEKKNETTSNLLSLNNDKGDNVIRKAFEQRDMDLLAIDNQSTYFTDNQRIEITEEILQNVPCDPNNPKLRGIEILLDEDVYESAYPLHDCELDQNSGGTAAAGQRQLLTDIWGSWKNVFKMQPLTQVRNYYGEQVAFYFAWLDVYGRMLVLPSIVGICTLAYGIITTARSPEHNEICVEEGNEESLDPFNVIPLTMCPICKPPACEAWEMIPEGCNQYSWNYRLDNESSILLTVFTSLWGIIFVKMWKRREAYLAAEWDTEDAENNDNLIRPEYAESATEMKKNPVTKKPEPHVPSGTMKLYLFGSICGTIAFLLFTCVCLIILVLSRIQLYGALKPVFGGKSVDAARWLTHILLLIMIMILEIVFSIIANKLTDFERPRTQRQWMKSYLWKMYIFHNINEFVPIAYAAWVKGKVVHSPLKLGMADELCDGGCIGEVTEIVAVLLIMRIVLSNAAELGIPMIQKAWRRFRHNAQVQDDAATPQYVRDYHLDEIELDGVSEDLMQMMIQFAFNVLLIPALPAVPLLCLINTIIQMRLDSIKYLQTRRRVIPIRTSGIHIWDQFLDITTKLGVLVNAAMLAFTSDNVSKMYYKLYYNPGNGIHGYTRFSLDKVDTKDFDIPEEDNEMLKENKTECWYPGFKHSEPPYSYEDFSWQIFACKWVAFGVFTALLFTIMWFINTFVSDIPQAVKEKIERRQFLIGKAKETTPTKSQFGMMQNVASNPGLSFTTQKPTYESKF